MIFYNSFSFYSYFSHHYACSISRDNFSSSSFFIFFLHHFYSKTKPITLPTSNFHQKSIVVPRQRRLVSQSQRKFIRTTSGHVLIVLFFYHSTDDRTRTNGGARHNTHLPYFLRRYLADYFLPFAISSKIVHYHQGQLAGY